MKSNCMIVRVGSRKNLLKAEQFKPPCIKDGFLTLPVRPASFEDGGEALMYMQESDAFAIIGILRGVRLATEGSRLTWAHDELFASPVLVDAESRDIDRSEQFGLKGFGPTDFGYVTPRARDAVLRASLDPRERVIWRLWEMARDGSLPQAAATG